VNKLNIDGITLSVLIKEFNGDLEGNFLKKVQMPSNGRFYFEFSHRVLYLSLLSSDCYCCFTHKKEPSPNHPNSFTMFLRKYLNGSRFISCTQLGLDRIMELQLAKRDEFGDIRTYKLFFELMGRNSNLIITDEENRILDSWRKLINDKRSIISGVEYIPYLGSGISIHDLRDKDYNYLSSIFVNSEAKEKVSRIIQNEFQGIGRQNLEEIMYRASIIKSDLVNQMNEEKILILKNVLLDIEGELNDLNLYLYQKEDEKSLLSPVSLVHALDSGYTVKKMVPSEAVELMNGKKRKNTVLNERKLRLKKILEKESRKIESNIIHLENDLQECAVADDLQKKAELIMGNIYKFDPKKNYEIVDVMDWNTGREKRIELNRKYNLSTNTQRMFKKAAKLKRRSGIVNSRISKLSVYLSYLEEINFSLDLAEDESDFSEIKQEMTDAGLIAEKKIIKKGQQKKKMDFTPRSFRCLDFEIVVGKNNRQNDKICRSYSREEFWFHAQKIPGSHVVINSAGRDIPDEVFRTAARLAAYFSKGRTGTKIPVDYTRLKYVKKPKGAAPGFVIYDHFKTITVDPFKNEEELNSEV